MEVYRRLFFRKIEYIIGRLHNKIYKFCIDLTGKNPYTEFKKTTAHKNLCGYFLKGVA